MLTVIVHSDVTFRYLPPAMKLGQGYVFTGICDSVNSGRCLPQYMLGYHNPPGADTHPREQTHPPRADPPWSRHHPPRADTTTPRADTTPPEQTPPRRRACWEIRSTHGRYASYWNAILLWKHLVGCTSCVYGNCWLSLSR